MNTRSALVITLSSFAVAGLLALGAGCGGKPAAPPKAPPSGGSAGGDHDAGHDHGTDDHDDGHDHAGGHDDDAGHAPAGGAGHGGAVIQLGQGSIGPFDEKATRDEGKIVAGKDAPVDVTVTPTAGSTSKATTVRFWIGTEDAKGSVKAKAEEETTDNWHTHAEVPDPLPAGSRFWVEVEPPTGEPFKASFDLKMQ
jgi:hypothetical protein